MRRVVVLAVVVFAVGVVVGGITWPVAVAQSVCGTPTADGALRFEGEGDAVTEPFRLKAGTALFHIEARGERLLSVEAHPAPGAGDWGPVLVTIESPTPYEGTVAKQWGGEGETILAVEHDGPWSVTIEQ